MADFIEPFLEDLDSFFGVVDGNFVAGAAEIVNHTRLRFPPERAMNPPMNEVTITVARGGEVQARLDALATLRLRVFREWPYLYDGDLDYEISYLETYANCSDAVVIFAAVGAEIIGASTAVPLAHEPPGVQAPFLSAAIDPATVFYFGESVLLPEWRGRGLGHRFMDEREKAAWDGGFALATFCAVERADEDPRRPADYQPLHAFWRKRGFERRPELHTTFSWKEIGETEESPKPMVFWTKALAPPGVVRQADDIISQIPLIDE